MKILSYSFSACFFLFVSMVTYSRMQDAAVCHGFKQFLGAIYEYTCEELVGGLSKNKQCVCEVNENKYVVRMLKEPLSARKSEICIHIVAARENIAPKIHYYDTSEFSFVIMDFINESTLTIEQAGERDILDLIALKVTSIAQIGENNVISNNKKDLFAEIVHYYKKIKEYNCSTLNCILEQALQKVERVCKEIENERRSLVFGHNDLHMRNIFLIQNDAIIIDWEMGAFNYELYDLANYSVYACLQEVDESYLLTKYLHHVPSYSDLHYFKNIKLLAKVFNAFGFLICLKHIPESITIESIKKFNYYATIFAQDSNANSDEFLYAIAISLLQEFFEEYTYFEHDTCDEKIVH